MGASGFGGDGMDIKLRDRGETQMSALLLDARVRARRVDMCHGRLVSESVNGVERGTCLLTYP
jgi:hypothetical protein